MLLTENTGNLQTDTSQVFLWAAGDRYMVSRKNFQLRYKGKEEIKSHIQYTSHRSFTIKQERCVRDVAVMISDDLAVEELIKRIVDFVNGWILIWLDIDNV